MDGEGMQVSHTSLQEQQEIKTDILKKELSNIQGWTLNLNWNDKKKNNNNKDKELARFIVGFEINSTWHALKTWFEFSRVKWYRNDLKGNKNYFEPFM